MSKQNAVVNPLNQCWDLERNQLNLKNPMYRDAIKSYVSSIEFPIHLRDIVNLGLVGTPTTKNGDYFHFDLNGKGGLVPLTQSGPDTVPLEIPTNEKIQTMYDKLQAGNEAQRKISKKSCAIKMLNSQWRLSHMEGLVTKPQKGNVNYFPINECGGDEITVISKHNEFFVSFNCENTHNVINATHNLIEQLGGEYNMLFEKRNEGWWCVGLCPLNSSHDETLRNIYHDTYMNLLMLSVRSKRANSETILIRKSAREQFEDTDLKIPQSYFHLPSKAFHFIDEVNNLSYIVSVKRGELQVVKIFPPANNHHYNANTGFNIPKDIKVNLLDEIVINIDLEDITDNEGYITTKSIKNGFNNYFNQNKYEQDYDSELETRTNHPISNSEYLHGNTLLNIYHRFGAENIMQNSPHMAVLSQLLTGVRLFTDMEETFSKMNSPLLEDFCKDTEFIIKLLGFMQDPRQKDIIKRDTILYRKEYKRGTKMGDEIKYKVWGQNVSLIRNDSKTTGAKNRSHHVNGHNRKQPIKDVQKYEEWGYVVKNPHDNPFVDMFIESHWRGDKELGEITTILMFGRQASGWSRKGIDWLQSISAKEKIAIKHALNGGEYAFPLGNGKMARVDGFCKETNTVYEFYGDYYHGNPKKYGADEYNKTCKKTHGESYENTMKREQAIISLGFNFVSIWECDYDNR